MNNFTFAASSAGQGHSSASKRHHKKKNLVKIGFESFNTTPNAKVLLASSSVQFSSFSGASLLLASRRDEKGDHFSSQHKGGCNSEVHRGQEIKQEPNLTSAATIAAQEACEKWRLRGNQAYTNMNFSKAEDCYTQGINCVSKSETSRSCLKALMLCYSNRAATLMALGRMRDALSDCMLAVAIDPDFLRVQVRAAKYDWDAATTANFLRKYGLINDFKLNIECNHATLSGHSCHHDLETARLNGLLGNIDANTGDPQVGWDTDQFMTDIGEATMVMLSVIRNGGLAPGGFNFDAKLRRESTDVEDMFIAHIAGMDTLARGLRNAAKLIEDGSLAELVRKRYQSFDSEIGAQIEAGKTDFEMLEKIAMEWGEPKVPSAKQELAEMIFQSAL